MAFCYMMQYMDKLALSQAALFNLREDLVCLFLFYYNFAQAADNTSRIFMATSMPGALLSFILAI